MAFCLHYYMSEPFGDTLIWLGFDHCFSVTTYLPVFLNCAAISVLYIKANGRIPHRTEKSFPATGSNNCILDCKRDIRQKEHQRKTTLNMGNKTRRDKMVDVRLVRNKKMEHFPWLWYQQLHGICVQPLIHNFFPTEYWACWKAML